MSRDFFASDSGCVVRPRDTVDERMRGVPARKPSSTDEISGVSIALATFNGADFLDAQLESLARQTSPPLELVVTDDCSTDATTRIVESFAQRAPFPVRLIRNERNLGWRANFFRAIDHCQGPLIALCDQDDVWHADKLSRVLPHFHDTEVAMVHHSANLIDASGKVIGAMNPGNDRVVTRPRLTYPLTWSNPFGLTMTFRNTLGRFNPLWALPEHHWVTHGPFPHDKWLFHLASILGSVVSLPDRLVDYRQHTASAIGWKENTKPALKSGRQAVLAGIDDALNVLRPFHRLVTTLARRTDEPLADHLGDAVPLVQAQLEWLEKRREIYTAGDLRTRVRQVRSLLTAHAYGDGRNGTIGRKGLVEDLCVGLFGSR